MKTYKGLLFFMAAIVLVGCKNTSTVFQQRKYTKHFHAHAKAVKQEPSAIYSAKDTEFLTEKDLNSKEEVVEAITEKQTVSKTDVSVLRNNSINKAEEIDVLTKELEQLIENPAVKKSVKKAVKSKSRSAGNKTADDPLLRIILAILLPPLGVALYVASWSEDKRFWIDFILWLPTILYVALGNIAFLGTLAAIIYALLVVTGNIR